MALRVVVAEDSLLVREGIVRLLEAHHDVEIVALCGNLPELLKDRLGDADRLLGALRIVADGGSVVDPKVVETLVAARHRSAESPLEHLTPRELEAPSEIAQGKHNAAVAADAQTCGAARYIHKEDFGPAVLAETWHGRHPA